MAKTNWKLHALQVLTALVVTFVRADFEKIRWGWDWLFYAWFAHWIVLGALGVVAGALIMQFHRFFLGYELGPFKDKITEVMFHVTMTVLATSVCGLLVARFAPQ